MTRKYIDCRDYPSVTQCTVAISADTDDELIEIAVLHAVAVHEAIDTPEFRNELRTAIKEGSPRA